MVEILKPPLITSHFAAVKHVYDAAGIQRETYVMCIKDDQTGAVINLTGYEMLCAPYEGDTPIFVKYRVRQDLKYVAHALNYLFKERYDDYRLTSLSEVGFSHLYAAFQHYVETPVKGKYRSQASINKYIKAVSDFFGNLTMVLPGCNITEHELFRKFTVPRKKRPEEMRMIYFPRVRMESLASGESRLHRDIPTEALELLVEVAEIYDQALVFPIRVLQYTGIRLGELCCIRQKDSPISDRPGISFELLGDTVVGIEIDLLHERQLRADGKPTGGIKKTRIQRVHPMYIGGFTAAYEYQMKLLQKTKFDPAYCPMFVNRFGEAMTADALSKRFQRLIQKWFLPRLFSSGSPKLIRFGEEISTRNLRMHALRHYFTVQLAINGCDAQTIASFRGDSSLKTAKLYLREKSYFMEQVRGVHSKMLEESAEDAKATLRY